MKKFNRSIIGLLLCCLVFGACSKKAENEESKKNVKNNESASFKKFSKSFFAFTVFKNAFNLSLFPALLIISDFTFVTNNVGRINGTFVSYCSKNKDYDLIEEIVADDLITIGIGELYETYDRAKNHIFD